LLAYIIRMKKIEEYLKHLPEEFRKELTEFVVTSKFDKGTEILREGQYVKMIPIVLEGVVKVLTRKDERELLLYYIESGESCIMSFNAGFKNIPSKVFAVTETDVVLLLMPAEKVNQWIKIYPFLNELFYNLYDQRYDSLLDTINQLLYSKLDQRLYEYLLELSRKRNSKVINIRHREIASDLGTAREVISRVMKKLEIEGKIHQVTGGIEII